MCIRDRLNRQLKKLSKGLLPRVDQVGLPGPGHYDVTPPLDSLLRVLGGRRREMPHEVEHRFRHLHQGRAWWLEAHTWTGSRWGAIGTIVINAFNIFLGVPGFFTEDGAVIAGLVVRREHHPARFGQAIGAGLARAVEDSDVVSTGALGQVLEAGRRLLVHDEEIPVGGVRITRSWQVARAPDGSVVCWMGRRKTVAPPRRAPGLGFDQVRT